MSIEIICKLQKIKENNLITKINLEIKGKFEKLIKKPEISYQIQDGGFLNVGCYRYKICGFNSFGETEFSEIFLIVDKPNQKIILDLENLENIDGFKIIRNDLEFITVSSNKIIDDGNLKWQKINELYNLGVSKAKSIIFSEKYYKEIDLESPKEEITKKEILDLINQNINLNEIISQITLELKQKLSIEDFGEIIISFDL